MGPEQGPGELTEEQKKIEESRIQDPDEAEAMARKSKEKREEAATVRRDAKELDKAGWWDRWTGRDKYPYITREGTEAAAESVDNEAESLEGNAQQEFRASKREEQLKGLAGYASQIETIADENEQKGDIGEAEKLRKIAEGIRSSLNILG